jgi:serine/threonine-protein kinase
MVSIAPVQPGDVLAGKYRVDRVLGEGGMGVVVAAFHLQLQQPVALKFLHGEAARRSDVAARFLREAQAAARIRSEHVARVSDVGTLPNGAPYLVMELLSGRDLAELLAQKGPLPVAAVADYVLQACEAIAEAHAVGIVHRDLKPANLFLSRRSDGSPIVKVIDFGISKATGDNALPDAQSLTMTTGLLGSPYYMSPEQVKSAKQVDSRTDVWALGVIVHELLTGAPPFRNENLYGLFQAIDQQPAPPLRTLRPDVPVAIEDAVLRCLEKEPSRRWETVSGLATALAPFAPTASRASADRISRLDGGVSTGTIDLSPATMMPARESAAEPVRTAAGWGGTNAAPSPSAASPADRSTSRVWLAVGAAAAVVATTAWLGIRATRSPSPHETASIAAPPASSSTGVPAVLAPSPVASPSSPLLVDPPPPAAIPARPSGAKARPSAAPPAPPPKPPATPARGISTTSD